MKLNFLVFNVLLLALAFPIIGKAQQRCTGPGQTPSTAFPVCGNDKVRQTSVPLCGNTTLYVPGCTGVVYLDKNPYWYKFTCYTSGTLDFLLTPLNAGDDYDWQLYDITGLDPSQAYTNKNIIIAGNWSGAPGPTGARPNGVDYIQCASDVSNTTLNFSKSPQLVAGREYLLLVSHFSDSQSGYDMQISGGTAVIVDPVPPQLQSVTSSCSGSTLQVKISKRIICSSISTNGSQFELRNNLGQLLSVGISAVGKGCSNGFDTDEITVQFPNDLTAGNYTLVLRKGTDNKSLANACLKPIPLGDNIQLTYTAPPPIAMDSVGSIACAPNELLLYYSKGIRCNTITANGSNFSIIGNPAITITGATAECSEGLTKIVKLRLSAPIYTAGNYTIISKQSNSGRYLTDECGQTILPTPASFQTSDTVSARFTHTTTLGCVINKLDFVHDGAHDVTSWAWKLQDRITSTTAQQHVELPASGKFQIQLTVSNDRCTANYIEEIVFDNEVNAVFSIPPIVCPEDIIIPSNESTGTIDSWKWDFGLLGNSVQRTPQQLNFIRDNKERSYPIQLIVFNDILGCSDTVRHSIRVLSNCIIAVPNAFTPNGDGNNDFFAPNNAIKARNMKFKVFNRWGELLFSTSNWEEKWDGKYKKIPQTAGAYTWFLEYDHVDTGIKTFQKGTVNLIR